MARPAGQGPQRHTTVPKVEPRSKRVREPAVAQIGGNYGDHITNKSSSGWRPGPLYGGKGYNNPVGPTNMALSGPGAGREVLRSGGQGTHGNVAPGNLPPNMRRDALENE